MTGTGNASFAVARGAVARVVCSLEIIMSSCDHDPVHALHTLPSCRTICFCPFLTEKRTYGQKSQTNSKKTNKQKNKQEQTRTNRQMNKQTNKQEQTNQKN
jgi:hypothetical protein